MMTEQELLAAEVKELEGVFNVARDGALGGGLDELMAGVHWELPTAFVEFYATHKRANYEIHAANLYARTPAAQGVSIPICLVVLWEWADKMDEGGMDSVFMRRDEAVAFASWIDGNVR